MRLPDADGFIVAAQKAINGSDVVYLHDAEGAPAIALVAMDFFREMTAGPEFPPREYTHDHIEADQGEEVPWL